MPKAELNGVKLHYLPRVGEGPDLVLMHGLAANLAFWYIKIAPSLMRDYRVTMYDLRGHGGSGMPASGYTTADMATDLHALLDEIGIDRAHLVGHSYGGAIALHYASHHPERVASLTLADTRIRGLQPTQRLKDWPNAEVWKKKLDELKISASLDDPEMGYRLLEILARAKLQGNDLRNAVDAQFSPFWLSKKASRTAEGWLRLLRTTTASKDFMLASGLTREKIRQINQPVLALFGEFSNCLPSCWGLKRHLPNCKVVIVPRAGHFHPMVRPAFFVRKLRSFLRGLPS
jgi:pimeloyl-ACP methyl ester carboxylesterase